MSRPVLVCVCVCVCACVCVCTCACACACACVCFCVCGCVGQWVGLNNLFTTIASVLFFFSSIEYLKHEYFVIPCKIFFFILMIYFLLCGGADYFYFL